MFAALDAGLRRVNEPLQGAAESFSLLHALPFAVWQMIDSVESGAQLAKALVSRLGCSSAHDSTYQSITEKLTSANLAMHKLPLEAASFKDQLEAAKMPNAKIPVYVKIISLEIDPAA